MRRLVALLAVVVAALAAAGCAGGPVGPSTAPLSDGTEVSPQRYLGDVDAAAATIREFSGHLDEIAPVARPAELRDLAPRMAATVQRARAVVERLESQRLADARLESQRERALPALRETLAAMLAVTTRAAAGQAGATSRAADDFREAVARLRALGTPVG